MIIMKIFNIILILLMSNLVLAQDVVYLGKDEKAPYEGYLTSPAKTKDLYNVGLERNSLQKQLDLSQKDNASKDKKIDILITQNDRLAQAAYNSQSLSTWEKIGYISLGVAIIGLGAYVAKEAAKP